MQQKKTRVFFFLLPENWEEKGHAIQHQCSCPMTPHHPAATLGQGLPEQLEQHCIDVTHV